jgi:hypothetical protein
MTYDKHLNIRISQEQLDWLDEMSDQSKQSTSEIIRTLIDKEIYHEAVLDREYEKLEYEYMTKDQQIEAQDRGERLVEDECQ